MMKLVELGIRFFRGLFLLPLFYIPVLIADPIAVHILEKGGIIGFFITPIMAYYAAACLVHLTYYRAAWKWLISVMVVCSLIWLDVLSLSYDYEISDTQRLWYEGISSLMLVLGIGAANKSKILKAIFGGNEDDD